jgi:hypothetical protein
MAETILEKTTCQSCGVDVREDTAFCYNCGKRVAPLTNEVPVAASGPNGGAEEAAIEKPDSDLQMDLERMFGTGKIPSDDKLAIAAAERKKARMSQRKPRKPVWVSADESSNLLYVLITLLITTIAAAIVFLTVYLK